MLTTVLGVFLMAAVDPGEVAQRYVGLLREQKYAAAAAMHDGAMKGALPEEKLAGIIRQVFGEKGPGACREETRAPVKDVTMVVLLCDASTGAMRVKVTVNAGGAVGGLFFAPGPAEPQPGTPEAAYVRPDRFTETPVTVRTRGFELPGILGVPAGKGPFAAVVLVHGSGPHDENETIGPNAVFKDIARGLASRGVMVLRYQKRSFKYGARAAEDPATFTMNEETVEDAVSAVALLQARPDVKGVVVVGHSQGGFLVPRIGNKVPALSGVVSMAGNVTPLDELMVQQVRYLSGLKPQSDEEKKATQQILDQAMKVKDIKPSSGPVLGAGPAYWLDLKGYNPAVTASSLGMPLLVMQGGRDYQVPVAEVESWKKGVGQKKNADFKVYPALNHLFMKGSGPSTPDEYKTASHVDEQVIADLAAFVLAVSPR